MFQEEIQATQFENLRTDCGTTGAEVKQLIHNIKIKFPDEDFRPQADPSWFYMYNL